MIQVGWPDYQTWNVVYKILSEYHPDYDAHRLTLPQTAILLQDVGRVFDFDVKRKNHKSGGYFELIFNDPNKELLFRLKYL